MTDLTDVATLLTALRDLLDKDLIDARSPFKGDAVGLVDDALDDLRASGLVQADQVTNYAADRGVRGDLAHALFGAERCRQAVNSGKF